MMSDVEVTGEVRKKKKSRHRADDEGGEERPRRKKSHAKADAADEVGDAEKKKKKKKHRDDETPEEKEERRRKRREKKEAKQAAADIQQVVPTIDDLDDSQLPDRVLNNPPVPLVDPGRPEVNESVEPVVADVRAHPSPPQPPINESLVRTAPPPAPKPKPKPKPKPTKMREEVNQPSLEPTTVVQPPPQQWIEPEPELHIQPPQQQWIEPEPVVQMQPPEQHVPQSESEDDTQQPPRRWEESEPEDHIQQPLRRWQEPLGNSDDGNDMDEPESSPQAWNEPQRQSFSQQPNSNDPSSLHQFIADNLDDTDDEFVAQPHYQQQPPQPAMNMPPTRPPQPQLPVQQKQPQLQQPGSSTVEHFDNEPQQQQHQQQYDDEDEPIGWQQQQQQQQQQEQQNAEIKKSNSLLGKLFASFRRGGSKRKQYGQQPTVQQQQEQPGLAEQGKWRSNPSMFNPNETPANTMDGGSMMGGQAPPQPRQVPAPAVAHGVRPIPDAEVRVILLDGEEISVPIPRKAMGGELLERVCEYIDLPETDYFGLTYVDNKERMWFWLDAEKKVFKQLKHCPERLLNFQVKFYPPEPSQLTADVTRYQLCLQVRQDIYTGKLPCTWVTQALLGSFQVQSELGDYDPTEHGEVSDTNYLGNFEFVNNQTPELVSKIAELHRGHKGLTPEVADLRYLETARRLEFYGVDLHPARDLDDVDITLGVCFGGVLVYKDRMRISRFAWPKILRISYRKNLFYLKIRSDLYENVEAVVGFKLMNHRWSKRLWKIAIENHAFFRLKEAQQQKSGSRVSLNFLRGSSSHRYSGRTMHQYRTEGGATMRQSGTFDRSLSKRMSASLPSLKGSHYGSFHSLNRMHPRDMRPTNTKPRQQQQQPPDMQRRGSSSSMIMARTGSVSILPTSAFNNRPSSRTPSMASDDLL